MSTSLLLNRNHDFLTTNSIVEQNQSLTSTILIKNQDIITLNANIDNYFKLISSNLKLNFSTSKSNFKNIVNNSDLRLVEQQNLIYGAELRSGFRGKFNYHIGAKWTTNTVKTTFTNSLTNNMAFLDLSYVFSDELNFQMQSERYNFSNLDQNANQYYA